MKTTWIFLVVVLLAGAQSALASRPETKLTLDEYRASSPLVVPKGNAVESGKGVMTKSYGSKQKERYSRALATILKNDKACIIKEAADLYQVDPVAIMGSIIGEHTFNVDSWDISQENYLYMRKRWITRFKANGIDIIDLLAEEKYRACLDTTDNNFDLWNCYDAVWQGDRRNGRRHQLNNELKWTFFNPVGSGYTYGYGQLGPERALMATDVVAAKTGWPVLSLESPEKIYDAILNPSTSIHYVAASNRIAIDLYRRIANFDISQNPGVIATLYNLGREQKKVDALLERVLAAAEDEKPIPYPTENYYGWFVNSKEDELRQKYTDKLPTLTTEVCQRWSKIIPKE